MAHGLEGLLTGHTLVKRYKIEEVCGRGGFAVVYRATDTRLGRPVAVKVITLTAEDPGQREVLRERLHKEARAAASLPHHPNLVTVHDVGTDPELGLDFLVMELLQGENLSQALQRGRPPLPRALRILRDAAEGLAVGHRAGLVHRDVKPGNIFLAAPHDGGDPDGFRVCVLDYGIAQAIEDDQTVTRGMGGANPLSPAFASPEQLRGDRDLSPATDVFSLGVVGYQLLTGERPFTSEPGQMPTGWTVRTPLRELAPEVGAGVEAVVMRAMSVDPRDRFVDADAFVEALDAATGDDAERALAARAHSPGIGALPLDDEIGVVDEDDRTMIAPAPRVAAAAAPAAAPHRPVPPLRPAHPAPRKKASKLPLVLVVALLLVAAAAYAALRGRSGADQAGTVTPGAAGDTTSAGTGGAALDDGATEGVPALPSRTGEDVDVPVASSTDDGGDGGGGEPTGGAPSASTPAPATPAPGAQPAPSGQVPTPPPGSVVQQPQQPTVTQPQPQPQQPPAARPPAQQPSRPPAQQPQQPQRPPVTQPQPQPQQPPQEPQPQPRPEPPLLGRPVEPQPPPAVTPAPNPNAPRDTIRIGNPQ